MADPRVKTIFEADDKGQQQAIARLQKDMEKLREENQKLAHESREHHEREEGFLAKGNDLLEEQVGSIKNLAVGYIGINEIIGKVVESQEKYNKLLEDAAHSSSSNAQAVMGTLAAAGRTGDADFWYKQIESGSGTEAQRISAFTGSVGDTFNLTREQQFANYQETLATGQAAGDMRSFAGQRGSLRHELGGLSEDDYTDLTVGMRQRLGNRTDQILSPRNAESIKRLRESGAFGTGEHSADLALAFQEAGINAQTGTKQTTQLEALLTEDIDVQHAASAYSGLTPKQQTLEHLRKLSPEGRRKYLETHQKELRNVIGAGELGSTMNAFANYQAIADQNLQSRVGNIASARAEEAERTRPGEIIADDVSTARERERIRNQRITPGRFLENAGNRFENAFTDEQSGYGPVRSAEGWVARQAGRAIGWSVGMNMAQREAVGQRLAGYALEGGQGGPVTHAAEETMRELVRMQAQQLEESRRQTQEARKQTRELESMRTGMPVAKATGALTTARE